MPRSPLLLLLTAPARDVQKFCNAAIYARRHASQLHTPPSNPACKTDVLIARCLSYFFLHTLHVGNSQAEQRSET